jgi:ribosomal protein S18 acetylase RimI-like enzyme
VTEAITIAVHDAADSERLGESVFDLVDRAFRGPPHARVQPRDEFLEGWKRQTARKDFRLLTIGRSGSRLSGFLFGYRGAPGTWWFDRVNSAVTPEIRHRWFEDAFEIVSMAVDSPSRGLGYGAALLRKCIALAPTRTAVLSTHRDQNPAVRLYLREGFEVVHPGLLLGPEGPPFIVMARDTTR